MKKTFTGKRLDVLKKVEDYLVSLDDSEIVKDKTYSVTVSDVRSLQQNDLFHSIIRDIAEETGELDINLLKKQIKQALGYYVDSSYETEDGTFIMRVFTKTSSMSSKELSEFILKVQVWAFETLGMTFDKTKK
jgi:hypothetical protein